MRTHTHACVHAHTLSHTSSFKNYMPPKDTCQKAEKLGKEVDRCNKKKNMRSSEKQGMKGRRSSFLPSQGLMRIRLTKVISTKEVHVSLKLLHGTTDHTVITYPSASQP